MNEKMPEVDVSVVICVRNGAHTIRRQLDALSAQVGAPPFEVVISNNGSTDETNDVVTEWAQGPLGSVTTARIIDSGLKPGIPFARNEGARAAVGRLLAYCDADDVVDRDWVAAHAAAVKEGMGGGQVRAVRTDGSPEPTAFSDSLQASNYLPHASGCNFSITREAFFDVGGFDESLPRYGCDDVEFSWRVQEAGYPLIYVPDAGVQFTITPRTRVVKKEFLMATARIAVAARHPKSESTKPRLKNFVYSALRHTAQLPWRLLRPGMVPRTRWIRLAVVALGRLNGYWIYFIRADQHPAELVTEHGDPHQ